MVVKKRPTFSIDSTTGREDAAANSSHGIWISWFCRVVDWNWGDEKMCEDNKADFGGESEDS